MKKLFVNFGFTECFKFQTELEFMSIDVPFLVKHIQD